MKRFGLPLRILSRLKVQELTTNQTIRAFICDTGEVVT
jgi:hypothetical protein